MGPGNEYSLVGISILYDIEKKIQYVEDQSNFLSKPLFDRDIAPKCYEVLAQIKAEFGKLEYDTIYLVNDVKVVKNPRSNPS